MNLRNPRHLSAAVVAVAVVLSAAAWFLVVSGKRSEATRFQTDVEAGRVEVVRARAQEQEVKGIAGVAPAPVLKTAMPDQASTATVLRELNTIASASGVSFVSVTPKSSVAVEGFTVRPFDTVFEGDFAHVSKFLEGLRKLVVFENQTLRASGRLYTVDAIDLAEGERKFPSLRATVKVNAYMFGTDAVPGAQPTTTPAS
jgi:Tfp pilus assembly protein PilO